MKTSNSVSVIIPVRNMARELDECLKALNDASPAPLEVIVVDDGSDDDSAVVARKHRAKVISVKGRRGANECRNIGAGRSKGAIFLFLDADTVPASDIVQRVQHAFSSKELHGAVGLYSAFHRHSQLASQYKNLWIRFSYLRNKAPIDWIFGAVSAIRASAFRSTGGFDGTLFMHHSGGDLELGKRMIASSLRIAVVPEIEVEHQKKHTLRSLLHNDLERSKSFADMSLRLGQFQNSVRRGFVNVYPAFLAGTVLSWITLLFGALTIAGKARPSFLFFFAGLYLLSCSSFLVYFAREKGLMNSLRVIGIMYLDHLVCAIGALNGMVRFQRGAGNEK